MARSPRALTKRAMFLATAGLVGRRLGVRAFRAAGSVGAAARPRNAALQFHTYNSGFFSLPSSSLIATRIRADSDDGDNDFEPTWTYVPYQPPKPKRRPPRRKFSSSEEWTVPQHINIPEDKISLSFGRSSGSGGQNVNKVNTRVELRFHLDSAEWIPEEVRQRLKSNESFRINKEGYMTVSSQEHRTQGRNRDEAMKKLQDIIKMSWPRPKVRKMRKGLSKEAKKNRRENKKKISLKKESRRRVDF